MDTKYNAKVVDRLYTVASAIMVRDRVDLSSAMAKAIEENARLEMAMNNAGLAIPGLAAVATDVGGFWRVHSAG